MAHSSYIKYLFVLVRVWASSIENPLQSLSVIWLREAGGLFGGFRASSKNLKGFARLV